MTAVFPSASTPATARLLVPHLISAEGSFTDASNVNVSPTKSFREVSLSVTSSSPENELLCEDSS